MSLLEVFLLLAVLSCSLVTGFIFTYAVVVMPGLSKLNDRDFLRSFQVTDGIIQNNQPLFMLTWLGSIISVITTLIISAMNKDSEYALIIIAVCVLFLLGVQGLTISIHIPLNNHVQKIDLDNSDEVVIKKERTNFENKWNFYNKIRTLISFSVTCSFLIILIIR